MGNDHRQRVLMFRTNMNEMNVEPVDFGHKLRQRVQRRLALSPVIIFRPIAREVLHHRERHALRIVGNVSRSGHLVASMRWRNSESSASGTLILNGRTAPPEGAASAGVEISLVAARAAEDARTARRLGDDCFADMIVLLTAKFVVELH